jgi:sarcosine oxidase
VSGFVRPEACIRVQLERARALGAELRLDEPALAFEQDGDGVRVTTGQGTYVAKELVLAMGAWLPGVLPPSLAAGFRVTRQVLYWFRAHDAAAHEAFRPARFPVYIWQVPRPQVIYGFPATGGLEEGVKIATEQEIVTTTADTVDRTVSAAETQATYETYVAPFLPGLSPHCVKSKVCLYTQVANARFVIDRLPDRPRIVVASPCSGHGFKHSAAIGELLAAMVLDGSRPDPRFSLG